ncbi:fluoride efflux transporter CrcB [Microbacterium sp. NPDC089180]|uniref:fluoride efflux transporter CrcB n=1 Tax=unclassified Microbacterium TaxID=2609290 RepID=UPI00344425AB
MTPLVFVAVAFAGGVGAALRYLLDVTIRRRTGERFPWGILVVNVTGALALGILSPLPADEAWRWILGTGLLGGYTTFSAVAVTTALLAEEGRTRAAVSYALLSFVGSVLAAALGLTVGSLL